MDVVDEGSEEGVAAAVTWRVWIEVIMLGDSVGLVGDWVDRRVVTAREVVRRWVEEVADGEEEEEEGSLDESLEEESLEESLLEESLLEESLEEEDEDDDPEPLLLPPLRGICRLLLSRPKRLLLPLQQGCGGSTRLPSQQNSPGSHSWMASFPVAVPSVLSRQSATGPNALPPQSLERGER